MEKNQENRWKNIKTKRIIEFDNIDPRGWKVYTRFPSTKDRGTLLALFKTKSQALAYAKAYMRKH